MKKREEAEAKKKQDDEMNKHAQQSYWRLSSADQGIKPKFNVEYEGSVAALSATATVGRQSFKSFNPEVEKLKESELRSRQRDKSGSTKQISDQEMAQTLSRPRLHDKMLEKEEQGDDSPSRRSLTPAKRASFR